MHAKLLPLCPTLCDPIYWSRQAPLSMGFSRQEYWSGLPFPSPVRRSRRGWAPLPTHWWAAPTQRAPLRWTRPLGACTWREEKKHARSALNMALEENNPRTRSRDPGGSQPTSPHSLPHCPMTDSSAWAGKAPVGTTRGQGQDPETHHVLWWTPSIQREPPTLYKISYRDTLYNTGNIANIFITTVNGV